MKVLKKTGVAVALLVVGMVLGALLFGPADIVQGQAEPGQLFAVAWPPSPCNLAVQSRIVTAEDGSATARLIASPPSPCTSLNLNIESFPADTAHCVEKARRGRVKKVKCEFTAEHQSTTFYFSSNARDQGRPALNRGGQLYPNQNASFSTIF